MPRTPLPPDAQGDNNLLAVQPMPFVFQGKPPAAGVLHQQIIENLSLDAGMSCVSQNLLWVARVWANTAPTATAVFTLNYIRPSVSITPVALGTITLTAGSKFATTISMTAGIQLLPGDILQVVAPTAQDATMADVAVTLPCYVT